MAEDQSEQAHNNFWLVTTSVLIAAFSGYGLYVSNFDLGRVGTLAAVIGVIQAPLAIGHALRGQ